MKLYALALVGAFAFVGCTHNSGTVVPTSGKLTVTPKTTSGGGTAPATTAAPAAGGDWGTTTGKKGGPCKPEIAQAYETAMANCTDPSKMSECQSGLQKFGDKYPNVSCSTTDNGAVVGIDTTGAGAGGDTPAAQTAPKTPTVAAGAKCPADFAQAYTQVDQYCDSLDEDDSSTSEWRQCQSLADRFINSYSDQTCVLPDGNLAAWVKIQADESTAAAQIDLNQ